MVSKILTVTVPNDPVQVIEVQVPGSPGPAGPVGPAGPPDIISIGTITTGAPGSQASATISGATPNRQLNLTIPQGPQGNPGPANTLTIGTINTLAEGQAATGTITGTSPNQILNLSIPRGYGVRSGGAAGDVLVKLTASDYDTGWTTPTRDNVPNTIVKRDNTGDSIFRQVVASWVNITSAPSVATDATRKDYVDNGLATKLNLSGGTMTGQLTVPNLGSVVTAGIQGTNLALAPNDLWATAGPFAGLWHDLFAFNRHAGAPVFETSADGATGWTAATRNDLIFASKENVAIQLYDGAVKKGARFTWNNSSLQYCMGRWLVIGWTYVAGTITKRVLVETSLDGVTWVTRHDSTGTWGAQPTWHALADNGDHPYFRLTISAAAGSTNAVEVAAIRLMTARWGNQGGGSENKYPYTWNAAGDTTFTRVISQNAPATNAELTRKDYVDAIGTSNSTPDTVVRRSSGSDISVGQVFSLTAAPSAASSLTRKDYVDGQVATRAASVHTHPIADLTATGTKDATTFLRGDGTWSVPPGAGGGGTVTVANITDATAIGRTVLTSADAAAVRTNIGAGTSNLALGSTGTTAAAGNHSHTAANISDSTTVGRSVLTAVDAPAARTAIGAGTSNLALGTTSTTAKAGDYAPPSDGLAGVATMRTLGTGSTQAAAGNHTHTATGISDSSTVGRSVLTAADATAARTAIGAGTASTKTDVGLGNVDNTSDANKPVSTAQQTALDAKSDKSLVEGYKIHDGTTTGGTRPTGYYRVRWLGGTTRPTNMVTGDIWEHDA